MDTFAVVWKCRDEWDKRLLMKVGNLTVRPDWKISTHLPVIQDDAVKTTHNDVA